MTPRQLIQTVTGEHGNCWQTCCAMLLGIAPERMPDQSQYDRYELLPEGGRKWVGPSYYSVLQPYLLRHHGVIYQEMHGAETLYEKLAIREPGWHMMTGRTVRSDAFDGARHVVVARYGELWWDPHPSRAGLLEEVRWAFLVPLPEAWRATWAKERCTCAECGPDGQPACAR